MGLNPRQEIVLADLLEEWIVTERAALLTGQAKGSDASYRCKRLNSVYDVLEAIRPGVVNLSDRLDRQDIEKISRL